MIMKLKNVKVGQVVEVKQSNDTFEDVYKGEYGTVKYLEDTDYRGYLTVNVRFPDGRADWGNHHDIKLLEDVD